MQDTIERSIAIAAPIERVWELVTEPGWWVPSDSPAGADRTPGVVVVRESEGDASPSRSSTCAR